MTNFERIKAMSIDEVAVVLERTADCEKYCAFVEDGACCATGNLCLQGITAWLESEVDTE